MEERQPAQATRTARLPGSSLRAELPPPGRPKVLPASSNHTCRRLDFGRPALHPSSGQQSRTPEPLPWRTSSSLAPRSVSRLVSATSINSKMSRRRSGSRASIDQNDVLSGWVPSRHPALSGSAPSPRPAGQPRSPATHSAHRRRAHISGPIGDMSTSCPSRKSTRSSWPGNPGVAEPMILVHRQAMPRHRMAAQNVGGSGIHGQGSKRRSRFSRRACRASLKNPV